MWDTYSIRYESEFKKCYSRPVLVFAHALLYGCRVYICDIACSRKINVQLKTQDSVYPSLIKDHSFLSHFIFKIMDACYVFFYINFVVFSTSFQYL